MIISSMEVMMTAPMERFVQDMATAQRASAGTMSDIEKSVDQLKASISSISSAEQSRAAIFARGFTDSKRLLGETKIAADSTAKSLEELKIDPEALKLPPAAFADLKTWQEKSAYAIGAGVGAGVVTAQAALEKFEDYVKAKAIITAAAIATGVAAAVFTGVYAAYKATDFAIGLLTGESYKSVNIDALIELNKPLGALKKEFKLTTSEASALSATLNSLGTSTDEYIGSFNAASLAVRNNSAQMDALGVAYKDAAGNALPMKDVLTNTSKVLDQYSSGWERNSVAVMLGFSSSAQVNTGLEVTAEKLAKVSARQAEYGLLIGQDQRDEISRYKTTMGEFNEELESTSQGFKVAIADNIMPILTDLADFFKEGWPSAVMAFRYSMATITSLFYGLKTVFDVVVEVAVASTKAVFSVFGGMVGAISSLIKGDWPGAMSAFVGGFSSAADRMSKIGENIVEYAKKNAKAMALAWGNAAVDAAKSLLGMEPAPVAPTGSKTTTGTTAPKATDKPASDATAIIASAEAYKTLSTAIKEKIEVQQREIKSGEKLTDGERMQIQFNAELATGKSKLGKVEQEAYALDLKKLIAAEKINATNQEAKKTGASAAEKETASYASIISSIKARTEAGQLELATGQAATESEKENLKITAALASGKLKLSEAHLAAVRAALQEQTVIEGQIKSQNAQNEVTKHIVASTLARDESTRALGVEYAMYGKSTDARELAMVAVKSETEMQKQLDALREKKLPITDRILTQLWAERDARTLVGEATMGQSKALGYAAQLKTENDKFAAESIADPKARAAALLEIEASIWQKKIQLAQAGTEAQKEAQTQYNTWYANQSKASLMGVDVARAKEVMDIMSAVDSSAREAAAGMAASFGSVGSAIGGLTTALTGYAKTQATIAAQLASDTKDAHGDPGKIAKAQAIAAQQGAQAQIKSYGDMAGAAKGFFKESSAGYKVMEGTEKAFRAYEMAMAVEAMAKKIFFKEGEVAANLTLNTAKLSGEAAASAASTGLAATEASAWGITAVVKAIASLPFPWNLAAGAATLAAVVAVGAQMMGSVGGGSVSVSEQRQASNGVGTVFGDSNTDTKNGALGAKSDSILHSLEIIEKNSGLGLAHTISMDASLRQLVASIGGLSRLLITSGDVTGANSASAGIATGSALEGMKVFGNSLVAGVSGVFYGAVTVIASKLPVIGGLITKLFGTTTSVIDQGIRLASTTLKAVDDFGIQAESYATVQSKRKFFGVTVGGSTGDQFKPLSDEINQQLTLVVLGLGNSIHAAADILGLAGGDFADRLGAVKIEIEKIPLKDLTGAEQEKALQNAFSKLGDDMVTSAVGSLEDFAKAGEGPLERLTRMANEYIQVSDVFAVLNTSFTATGLAAVKLAEDAITAAGGLEKLTEGTGFFVENFLTEAEKMAPIAASVKAVMGAMGKGDVDTIDEFKVAVQSAAAGMAVGADGAAGLYAALIAVAPQFKAVTDYAIELSGVKIKTASEIRSERNDLQDQYDELTMTSTQLRAKERATIADSNLTLYDSVQAEILKKEAVEESNTILGIQASMYEAMGDKAKAAAVLELQHTAALVDMTPAVAAASIALWDAQKAEKARNTELTTQSTLLGFQAQYAATVKDKVGAAAVAQAQFNASLKDMTPEVARWATLAHNAKIAQDIANDATEESNKILALEAQTYEANGDVVGAALTLQKQHNAALADLSPALAKATRAMWDAQAAAKALGFQKSMASSYQTDEQKVAGAHKDLDKGFADLHLTAPTTKPEWLAISEAADPTTKAGQDLLAALELLRPAFDIIQTDLEETAKAAAEAAKTAADALASTNKGYQDQIDTLRKVGMTAAQVRTLEIAGMGASTIALYDRLHALQTEQSNRALEIENMKLAGNQAGALAAERAAELVGLDASTAALVRHRNALQDQAAALELSKSRQQVQAQIMDLQNNKAGALAIRRRQELDAMDALLRPMQRTLNLVKDLTDAYAIGRDIWSAYSAEGQKLATATDDLNGGFKRLNLSVPQTGEEFVNLALGIDVSTEAGRALLTSLNDLRPAFDTVQAHVKEVATARAAQELEMFNLTHTAAEQAAHARQLEIDAMDWSLRSRQLLIYALQDEAAAAEKAKAVADERADIELEIAQALGNTTLAREREIATLDESNRALKRRAYALADADQLVTDTLAAVQRAIDAQKTSIQAAADAQTEAIQAGIDAGQTAVDGAQKSVDSLKGIFDDITSAVKTLRGNIDPQTSMAQAKSFIDMALSLAQAGAMPDAERLRDAIGVVTNDQREMYASRADFAYAQLVQAGKLEALGKLTGEQKTVAEKQLDSLTSANTLAADQIKAIEKAAAAQIKALDQQWAAAQDAVSVMRGVDLSVQSVATAVAGLQAAINALAAVRTAAATATGITGTLPTTAPIIPTATTPDYSYAGGVPTAPISTPTQAPGDLSGLTRAQTMYAEYLGTRAGQGSAEEILAYVSSLQDSQALASLESLLGTSRSMESSDDLLKRYASIPGFASGGDHLGGLRLVGENGPELESTGPSRIWNFDQTRRMMSGGGGEDLKEVITVLRTQNDRLEKQNERLEKRLEKIEENTRSTTRLIDSVTSGGNALRTDVVKSVPVAVVPA